MSSHEVMGFHVTMASWPFWNELCEIGFHRVSSSMLLEWYEMRLDPFSTHLPCIFNLSLRIACFPNRCSSSSLVDLFHCKTTDSSLPRSGGMLTSTTPEAGAAKGSSGRRTGGAAGGIAAAGAVGGGAEGGDLAGVSVGVVTFGFLFLRALLPDFLGFLFNFDMTTAYVGWVLL